MPEVERAKDEGAEVKGAGVEGPRLKCRRLMGQLSGLRLRALRVRSQVHGAVVESPRSNG